MTVPNQIEIKYAYNNDELLSGITQGTATSVALNYDADLRPSTTTLPDGVAKSATYDAASELTGLSYADGPTNLGSLKYAYDANSNVTGISGTLARTNLPPAVTNTYNADNELATSGTATLTYDHAGNLTNDGTNTYTSNDRGQVTAIAGPTTNATFAYDPFGRRASDTVNGTSSNFVYDGANMVQQLAGTTPTANYLTGGLDETFQVSNLTGTSSLLTDQLGSTIALANGTGQITTSYTYDPYGAVDDLRGGQSQPHPVRGDP